MDIMLLTPLIRMILLARKWQSCKSLRSYYIILDKTVIISKYRITKTEQRILGTLRSAAAARGIKAITVEIGNPQTFQDLYIQVKKKKKILLHIEY